MAHVKKISLLVLLSLMGSQAVVMGQAQPLSNEETLKTLKEVYSAQNKEAYEKEASDYCLKVDECEELQKKSVDNFRFSLAASVVVGVIALFKNHIPDNNFLRHMKQPAVLWIVGLVSIAGMLWHGWQAKKNTSNKLKHEARQQSVEQRGRLCDKEITVESDKFVIKDKNTVAKKQEDKTTLSRFSTDLTIYKNLKSYFAESNDKQRILDDIKKIQSGDSYSGWKTEPLVGIGNGRQVVTTGS